MLKVEPQQVSEGIEWLSLSDVARRTGVSVASVCRKVKQLEQSGLLTSRMTGAGGSRLVNIDEFIRVQESLRDAVQTGNSAPRGRRKAEAWEGAVRAPAARETPAGPTLQDEQMRRTRVDADLKELLLVANVVRNGEGPSCDKLRAVAPNLWQYEPSEYVDIVSGKPPVSETMLIRDGDLARYVRSAGRFWGHADPLPRASLEVPVW